MQHLYHFDDYIQKHVKHTLHPNLNVLYSKFPSDLNKLKNLIFYGPSGVGKYTQVLSCIRKYSPSDLKYEKRLKKKKCFTFLCLSKKKKILLLHTIQAICRNYRNPQNDRAA